ncbi:Uncharacterized conserved protein [Plasmopara halstedii]|uniref:Uncharacterized conserved protein n=1 Tax=Plasmopara halstedii TaxID=4781 RepID=A0A0P1A9L1_PLAHL|nr:Uncharacterized conserved protein [Plasmopara halstedii]CEG36909.1 Uncharacterized conserved protein [Plasmopara halstedii]|eukprot:XP_024573278.1 Uncharacterized conserved protein [Plasmopara halstedii]
MSFFGYRGSSRSSQQETHLSETERLRGRQLASLVRAGGRAKNQQQTSFEVPVLHTSRGPLTLQLQLPSDFPVRVPRIKASIPLQHQWLDTAGNVRGHPDLDMWTVHSDLGRIVTEIAKELRESADTVPESKQIVPPTRNSMPTQVTLVTPHIKSTAGYASANAQHKSDTRARHTQMPVIPSTFLELEELSPSQLQKLNSDEHAIKIFVDKLTLVTEFTQLRDQILHSNMGTAMKTLGHESELRNLQKAIELQRAELRAAQQMLAEKQARQQRIAARHRPDALLEQLSLAAKSVDNESDEIAMQFTHGDIDVAHFLSAFLPQRNLYHERTLKLARVQQH